MASVVFPAIGTGNLGFPKDLVARIMLTEFQDFNATNLREVTVIVHPSDKESIQVSEAIYINLLLLLFLNFFFFFLHLSNQP